MEKPGNKTTCRSSGARNSTEERSANDVETPWPLSYRMKPALREILDSTTGRRHWWSHLLYRDSRDKAVTILYSKTKAQSEAIAQQFLNEPILGFDMEWPWDSHKRRRLQEKVSLIQLACEDKIALFHIGLHPGGRTQDLIAPSLRKIIESPNIVKTGVAVLSADMARLARYFSLKPKAAFELSHLHRLVIYGAGDPQLVTTKLVSLANLVQDHLGLPLWKGNVRKSDWSKALNQSQRKYAAGDAYAGFMLFHCMNAKRLAMDPVPPLPLVADKYLPFALPKIIPVQLEPVEEGGQSVTAEAFFRVQVPKAANTADQHTTKSPVGAQSIKPRTDKKPLDASPKTIYGQLSRLRKDLARAQNIHEHGIASNATSEALHQPTSSGDESIPSSAAFGSPKHTTPLLSTGLSFTLAETTLEGIESKRSRATHSSNGKLVVPIAIAPQLKRKRCESPAAGKSPPSLPQPRPPLANETRLFKNKMEAYSKRVASMLRPRPTQPLLAACTLDAIVAKPPRSKEELDKIPGIAKLVTACAGLNRDLLGKIIQFAGPQ